MNSTPAAIPVRCSQPVVCRGGDLKMNIMEVYYDFELNEKLEQHKNPNNVVLTALRDFVKSRYSVLKEDIEKDNLDKESCFIVLSISNGGLGITQFNIPPHLVDKVKNCITKDDFDYITNVLLAKMNEQIREN